MLINATEYAPMRSTNKAFVVSQERGLFSQRSNGPNIHNGFIGNLPTNTSRQALNSYGILKI